MHIAFTITIRYRNLPIPFISISKDKKIQIQQKAYAEAQPEPEILPIPAQVPTEHVSDGRSYSERTYNPDKRYRRGTGPLVGTERYRAIHVRRDLIQWFIDRQNRPLTETQMRTMKKSPFRHAWVKCELTCDHRIVSTSTLRRVLRNERSSNGEIKNTLPVGYAYGDFDTAYFVRTKKKFTLNKDFYKNLVGTLNVPEYKLPTPPMQIPTEPEATPAYVRENSDLRR
jgi:hypothetical protein